MLSILINLLIVGLIIYVLYFILERLPFDSGIKQIILVVAGVLALIWILQILTGGTTAFPLN